MAQMQGFHSLLIHFDVLRVCYGGFGPDWVASVLQLLFPGDNKLAAAHDTAKSRAKLNAKELSCDEFTYGFEGGFASLQAKGMDIKLLILWLVSWLLLANSFVPAP